MKRKKKPVIVYQGYQLNKNFNAMFTKIASQKK